MTLSQILPFAIIGAAVAMFVWGRFRYDLVAIVALLLAVVLGVVPAGEAFSGFTSEVVVVIACALVVSAAVRRTGVVEQWLQPVLSRLKTPSSQVPVLAGATGVLSMATKNVGALAILMPVATRLARATGTSRASLLMPMSFLSLLGGLVTLVGTSTNIIVSQVRQETLHRPFQMFDFAPVGLVLTGVGLVFVSFAWRALPRDRDPGGDIGDVLSASFVTEARLPDDWPEHLARLDDLHLDNENVRAAALIHGARRNSSPSGKARLAAGDVLVLEGPQESLNAIFTRTPLVHARADKEAAREAPSEEIRTVEAVVERGSMLVGRSAARVQLKAEFGVNLLGISRSGARIADKLGEVTFRVGDVVVIEAGERTLPGAMQSLGLLPLVERSVQIGGARRRYLPILVLAAAMVLLALHVVPVSIAFFGAAVVLVAAGSISMREAYGALDGQLLVLIGALIPVTDAIQTTGGAAIVAGGLASLLHGMPPLVTLGALMATAMLCTAFLQNGPAVLVLAPISVALAQRLGLNPDAFLMAVATGAGCDFLTPVGHQCNTLVMGPGGYRFGDYARLGAPLSLLVLLVGSPMIAWVWPLA